jgi:hypothetical protein
MAPTRFQPLDAATLAAATGGIFYGEHKSPTGERWAANVDAASRWVFDKTSPYVGRNAAGVALLVPTAWYEFVARTAGHVVDGATGSHP